MTGLYRGVQLADGRLLSTELDISFGGERLRVLEVELGPDETEEDDAPPLAAE